MRLKRYRLYLDFQAGGDIYHAVYPYIRNWYKKYPSQNQFIPEGFIWYMLKALATACLVLQKGTVSGGEVEGWRSITHLDLQTTNVLLDTTALLKEEPLDEPLGIFHEADTQELGGSDKAVDGSNTNWGKEPPFVPILTDFGISFFSPESHGCPLSDNPEDFLISVCGRYPPVSVRNNLGYSRANCVRKCINNPLLIKSNWARRQMFGASVTLHGH